MPINQGDQATEYLKSTINSKFLATQYLILIRKNDRIMTGFLVGDKITLLNRILENKQNLRVAALANKFSNNGQFTTIRYS